MSTSSVLYWIALFEWCRTGIDVGDFLTDAVCARVCGAGRDYTTGISTGIR